MNGEKTVNFCPRAAAALLAILVLPGCALTPQTVNLNPQVQSTAVRPIAAGQPVTLVVVDMRPSSVLGNRGLTGTAYGGANLSTAGDITQVVQRVVADGLAAEGFSVTPTKRAESGNQLRVEVTNLQYMVVPGIITETLRSEATLHAVCLREQIPKYDHVHRGVSEEQIFFAQFAKENEAHVNAAFSDAITQMLADTDLLACMQGK